jgi:hypothetical protein
METREEHISVLRISGDCSPRRKEQAGEEPEEFRQLLLLFEVLTNRSEPGGFFDKIEGRLTLPFSSSRFCETSLISEEVHQDLEDKRNSSGFFDFRRGPSGP